MEKQKKLEKDNEKYRQTGKDKKKKKTGRTRKRQGDTKESQRLREWQENLGKNIKDKRQTQRNK